MQVNTIKRNVLRAKETLEQHKRHEMHVEPNAIYIAEDNKLKLFIAKVRPRNFGVFKTIRYFRGKQTN